MRFSPACKCCNPACTCTMRCWPWPWAPWTEYNCLRPHESQIGELCQDLVLYKLRAILDNVTNQDCDTCNYAGDHCLWYVGSELTEVQSGGGSGPDDTTRYYSRVTWESQYTAGCGPTVPDPLPALTAEFTDDGASRKWTLYLNTTDTRGGIGTYDINSANWNCGYHNTLTRRSTSSQCNLPPTAVLGPCYHCVACNQIDPYRNVYEWQITASGFSSTPNCFSSACEQLDGVWILGVGRFLFFNPFDGAPILDQCTFSAATPAACDGPLEWLLRVELYDTPPTIHATVYDRISYKSATWKGHLTDCTGPFTLTLDRSDSECNVPSTITAKPL